MTLTKRPRKAPGRAGTAPEAKMADPGTPIPIGALEQHVAIVGRTGSGKSYAARGAVEALLEAGRQVVVLDPTGVWWGLRAGADGGPPPSSEELVSRWCEAVGAGGAGRMLAVLAGRYPATVDREALAEELGLAASGGTFSTYLSRLVSNGLATRLPEGVRAAGELFPGGSEAR